MLTARIYVETMSFKSLVVHWLLLAISVQTVFSRPIQESNNIRRRARSTPIHEDVTFGNISITGKLDDATKRLAKEPRCGVSDISQKAGQQRTKRDTLKKWHHVNLTWSLRTRRLENIDLELVRSDLNRAFQVWANYSKLTFREVNSESADILVSFEKGNHSDGYPFDGPHNTLGHAFSPGPGLGGDAHFDMEEKWMVGNKTIKNGYSLFLVAVHEFGHSLGLSHSETQDSVMFKNYREPKSNFELPNVDRISIQTLYGAKNDKIWGDIPVYRPTSQRPEPVTPSTARTVVTKSMTSITTPVIPVTYATSRPIPPRRPPAVVVDDKPDFCNTSFDAVSVIRMETFFFKGKYTWRIGTKGVYAGYPAPISRMWYNLTEDMNQVDAVYERQDGNIVFFIGRQYYLFDGINLLEGYPKPLTTLGLPEELDRVDAAFVWGHNSKTYIFSGTMYWRFDDETGQMELDYPQDISYVWRGAGYNIDAAFQWNDGSTYFFKNRNFWKFNDLGMRVEQEEPRSIGEFWFNCTATDGVGGNGDRLPFTKNKGNRKTVAGHEGRFRPPTTVRPSATTSALRRSSPPIISRPRS